MEYRYSIVRINCVSDASVSCKTFVNFDALTPQSWQSSFVNFWYNRAKSKNWHIQPNISGYTGPIFTVFSLYESALRGDDQSWPIFPICQGSLLWQIINVGTTCILCTPFHNKLQYHYLDVCINSGDDGATSRKNLVNFCLVTTEMTELICILVYLYRAKINLHTLIHCAAIQ